jgi:hypothetical protein
MKMIGPRDISVLLVVAVHLFSAVAVEYAHLDRHGTGSSSTPEIASHECGADERHLPTDGTRACAACLYAFSLVATSVSHPNVAAAPLSRVELSTFPGQSVASSDLFHSGKRGPPAV